MPRPPRYELVGVPQQVIALGNNRQATCFADADDRAGLGWLGEAAARHGCSIHADVRMTHPVHLLLTPQVAGAIGKVMQSLGRCYVQCVKIESLNCCKSGGKKPPLRFGKVALQNEHNPRRRSDGWIRG